MAELNFIYSNIAPQALVEVVQSSIDTKFVSRWGTMISDLAVKAALTVYEEHPNGKKEIDLKR